MLPDGISLNQLTKELKAKGPDRFLSFYRNPFLLLVKIPGDAQNQFKEAMFRTAVRVPEFTTIDDDADEGQNSIESPLFLAVEMKKSDRNEYSSKITIGRTHNNDIVIRESRISKLHAFFVIPKQGEEYQLLDVGSSNGTRVNGRRLEPGKPVVIKDKDSIVFWQLEFQFLTSQSMIERIKAQ